MPYIFHSNNRFTLIDSSTKYGVFCQIFASSHGSKPIQIHPQHTLSYSAHMDESGKLYVALMPDDSHLHYYIQEGNRFKRYTLVSNMNSSYHLAAPMIYTLENTPYIIYLSHQANTDTYDFVQENLFQPQLTPLMTCYTEPTLIKSYTTTSKILVFFVTYDEAYHLNAFEICNGTISSTVYLTTASPISDYSICIDDDVLYITYVCELHGKYQVAYFNTQLNQITLLTTTQYPCAPIVFCYCNFIWINAIINSKLQMLISIDDGQTFSLPAPCSLQNNIHRCYFLTHKTSSFVGQEVYACIGSSLKLCTLAMIDLPRFHPNTHIAPELELLLEGFMLSISSAEEMPIAPSSTPQAFSKAHNLTTSDYAATSNHSISSNYPASSKHFTSSNYISSPNHSVTPKYTTSPDYSATPKYTDSPNHSVASNYTDSPDYSETPNYTTSADYSATSNQSSASNRSATSNNTQASSSNSMDAAKNAFMSELSGWELPPRI